MRILVLTHSPSPYQVELLDAVGARAGTDLTACYLFSRDPGRRWAGRTLRHRALFLDSSPQALLTAQSESAASDLVVFNYYVDPRARQLLAERSRAGKPWVFWGERPGFKLAPAVGRWVRRWRLKALHRSQAAIWGIGQWAVEAYRAEFGGRRRYHNIPYFSNLDRFTNVDRVRVAGDTGVRTVLFSGALIERKGIDLVGNAFCELAMEFPRARLKILGGGPLEESLKATLAGVQDRVEFLGFRDWPDLPSVYQSADLLCVPSRYDGWGLVVPEGLAAGLPVIATGRMGAAIDLIEHGHNGWRIPAGDGPALTAALREALALPPEGLAGMQGAARASVGQHQLEDGAERFLAAARQAVAEWAS